MMTLAVVVLACDGSGDPPKPPPEQPPAETTTPPADRDGDGFPDAEDCAPDDPSRYPDAPERCNGLDDDCDGLGESDYDGDGFAWCEDCYDGDPDAYPGADDPLGDGVDQDCDGTDGQGHRLPAPTYPGEEARWGTGFALAAADFDGDGCDDLAISRPGDGTAKSNPTDRVEVRLGCGGAARSVDGAVSYMFGYSLGMRTDQLAVFEAFYRTDQGRIAVYDETFGPGATPRLEIIGGFEMAALFGMAVLGDPPQYIQFAGLYPPTLELQFNLVSADRTGVVDLTYETADVRIATGSYGSVQGAFAADVGDRDGDGAVDLALPVPVVQDTVYFFGEVGAGPSHVSEAPEVWRGVPGSRAGEMMGGGGDLDGDGLDDAVVGATFADGGAPLAGQVYVVPWLGAGEFDLTLDAPAHVDGEFTLDWPGYATAIGDLDADGQDDLVVGAPGTFAWEASFHGKVMVFLGPVIGAHDRYTADLLYVGEVHGDHAGAAVALGDFDGSGRLDLAIGAPFADADEVNSGAVYLLTDPL